MKEERWDELMDRPQAKVHKVDGLYFVQYTDTSVDSATELSTLCSHTWEKEPAVSSPGNTSSQIRNWSRFQNILGPLA